MNIYVKMLDRAPNVTYGGVYKCTSTKNGELAFWDDRGGSKYVRTYKTEPCADPNISEHISQDDTLIDDGQNRDLTKYDRLIKPGITVDVYDVLIAFEISCPALAHALKKLLAAGSRGVKSTTQDKQEAIASIKRSIELEKK